MSSTARSVYELHIVGPTMEHRRDHHTFLAEILAAYGSDGGSPTYLTIEITDRRSGLVVRTMGELPVVATGLARSIEADLDALDADSFAKKWLRDVPTPSRAARNSGSTRRNHRSA